MSCSEILCPPTVATVSVEAAPAPGPCGTRYNNMLTAIRPTKIPMKILVRNCLFSNRPAIPCFSLFYAVLELDKLQIIDDCQPRPKMFLPGKSLLGLNPFRESH